MAKENREPLVGPLAIEVKSGMLIGEKKDEATAYDFWLLSNYRRDPRWFLVTLEQYEEVNRRANENYRAWVQGPDFVGPADWMEPYHVGL